MIPKITYPNRFQRLLDVLHYKFRICTCCHRRLAEWIYMPTTNDNRLHQCCDICVPGGCSCNTEPIDGNIDNQDPSNWYEPVDEKGRKYPCCEWWEIER